MGAVIALEVLTSGASAADYVNKVGADMPIQAFAFAYDNGYRSCVNVEKTYQVSLSELKRDFRNSKVQDYGNGRMLLTAGGITGAYFDTISKCHAYEKNLESTYW